MQEGNPRLRLLACFAHPDDEAFPVGGTLATYAAKGVQVRLICATLGEEGEIRQPGSATRETLAQVRLHELRGSCTSLGIEQPLVLGYRDSGMDGDRANHHPAAFTQADAEEVVSYIEEQMLTYRPQVVLTFGPDGLYGHPDHIAIHRHTTAAFHRARSSPLLGEQTSDENDPGCLSRLFYSVRPKGFRTMMTMKLREAGIDAPMPPPERLDDGVDPELIHLEVDTSEMIEKKIASQLSHRTQQSPSVPTTSSPERSPSISSAGSISPRDIPKQPRESRCPRTCSRGSGQPPLPGHKSYAKGGTEMVSPTDPNQVLLTGENSFMRLSHEDGGPLTVRASHWRVLLSPGGPGHVLFLRR